MIIYKIKRGETPWVELCRFTTKMQVYVHSPDIARLLVPSNAGHPSYLEYEIEGTTHRYEAIEE